MSYSFEKDDKGKSFEMKLDDATILTAFLTEDSDSGLPEVADGYYGGIGEGVMSGEWTPAGGGGSPDLKIATVYFDTTNVIGNYEFEIDGAFAIDFDGLSYSTGQSGIDQFSTAEDRKLPVILYKNKGLIYFDGGENLIFKDANNNVITEAYITEDTTIYVLNAQ